METIRDDVVSGGSHKQRSKKREQHVVDPKKQMVMSKTTAWREIVSRTAQNSGNEKSVPRIRGPDALNQDEAVRREENVVRRTGEGGTIVSNGTLQLTDDDIAQAQKKSRLVQGLVEARNYEWIRGYQECGSRKVRPREVIPPLRSLRGGNVGDRWALDVADPFPVSEVGQRYMIAAVEYVTRYAVATTVSEHTAEPVAGFLMKSVVLKFGAFRELLTDGTPELTGKAIDQLVIMLQAQQTNPVPYRPQLVGLVARFHQTWKDVVATYIQEAKQCDRDVWADFAVFAYNSGEYSTVKLSPHELMMGRKLRSPNALLRRVEVAEAGELAAYHERLLRAMKSRHRGAKEARRRQPESQAKYYNRKARQRL
ncbi:unnamed protein product [Phytophthora fragariaefolia]|uniref:Unnamed protein product n=1 Tax=Phytophthora fragariaefolia TaxID=1490495 RepID=A0A9W6YE20_9STRA|nr:unnamed protein product [Phytophthora fragariaefolia]